MYFLQITHTEEMPESMMMKNAVISVFFLRFLQHGKYFKKHVPEKKKVDYVQFFSRGIVSEKVILFI